MADPNDSSSASDMEADTADETVNNKPNFPEKTLAHIKNKQRRRELYVKLKLEKQKAKRLARKKRQEEAKALGDAAPPKQVPRTLENTREPDPTMVDPEDEEVQFDEATDEMSSYFDRRTLPKILITTSDNPHTATLGLCKELRRVIPNSTFERRKRSSIKKMVKLAVEREFTDIMVINEDRRHPNGMLLIHLPEGPTAYFKISNVKLSRKMKDHAVWSGHRPEVILNNFNTRLGHTVGRMLASLFHYDPEFNGRRVVTFHNQRDYIFFRHHRYEFKEGKRAALHEIGPRFTLRLKSLQKGTFDTKYGEYEWVLKRHEMETSRRRFFL